MNQIEQKLKNLGELSTQVSEAERVLKMRMGQYDDALKDVMTKDFGYRIEGDKLNFQLHDLMRDAIKAAKR